MVKIFGCGLYRTGTSSLHVALHTLGFRSVHHLQYLKAVEDLNRDRGRPLLWGIEDRHDAFLDGKLMYRFVELDRQYPGSKFICTRRDENSWVRSILKRKNDDALQRVPLLEDFDEEHWREHYRKHYAAVDSYFRGRADLLDLHVCGGDGWEPLCKYLGLPVPALPFPFENAAGEAVSPFWRAVA